VILTEGKTKRIIASDQPGEVILETKDDLTGGDAAKKETIQGISVHKTRQAANVFRLLESRGIPTAFIRTEGDRRLICHACEMLPLELVMRRFAWGSFLKRAPDLESTAEAPHRFPEIRTEFFHKHAVVVPPLTEVAIQMGEDEARDRFLKDGIWAEGVYTDPLIEREGQAWALHPAKLPVSESTCLMRIEPLITDDEAEALIRDIMLPTFEALEDAWSKIETVGGPVSLADIKIEVGRREKDGKLAVADVVDNDSWRIWPGADPTKQLDKQCFREDHPLAEVAEKYQLVADLTSQFA
jgi:phosphoribosylaminoimidazole-succinocarboxamide synthase